MKYSDKELRFIVGRLDHLRHSMTEWEENFYDSIAPRVMHGLPLSSKQAETLSKIWDKMEDV